MQKVFERRHGILCVMSVRRYDKIGNLAQEFNVSRNTMCKDIEFLMQAYPLYTVKGAGGGVYVVDGWYFGMRFLSDKQLELLMRLETKLSDDDINTMQSILKAFSVPRRR